MIGHNVVYTNLAMKIKKMKLHGNSYSEIEDRLNAWRVPTRSKEGKWHAKTVRELIKPECFY